MVGSKTSFCNAIFSVHMRHRYRDVDTHATWETVKVMITFGDKYDIPEMYGDGVRFLEAIFPPNIADWDRSRDTEEKHWEMGIEFEWIETVDLASVTRTLQNPRLHAAVLYQCCSLPIADLLPTLNDDDATSSLSAEDLQTCLKMREKMPGLWLDLHCKIFDPLPETCKSGCKSQVINMFPSLLQDATKNIKPSFAYDPLYPTIWNELFTEADSVLCPQCVTFCRERHTRARQDILTDLLKWIEPTPAPAEVPENHEYVHYGLVSSVRSF